MRKPKVFLTFILAVVLSNPVLAQTIQERFEGRENLVYKIYFNGVPSGYIEWTYLGKEKVDTKEAHVLFIKSDTKILKLLNMTSNEKVFLDTKMHLPLKVERDIVFFGKKEFIEEIYNQNEGYVKIRKVSSKTKESIIQRESPIHNILALLYFFPESIDLKKGKWMVFNLPTQELKIKMVRERILKIGGQKKNTYFLIGRGAKRFSLWLDKETRLPLRLEFIFPLGKVSIKRVDTILN